MKCLNCCVLNSGYLLSVSLYALAGQCISVESKRIQPVPALSGVNSESLKTSKKGIKMVVMFVIVCSEIDHDE